MMNPHSSAGVEFTETMRGWWSLGSSQYSAGAAEGKAQGSPLEFTVTVHIKDVEAMIADPAHRGQISGVVRAPALGPDPFEIDQGEFGLFVDNRDTPQACRMTYRLPFVLADGQTVVLDGFKDVHHERGFDLWSDTTTLFTRIVREGDHKFSDEDLVGSGILKISVSDFAHQLTTMRAVDARNPADGLKALARFGAFFAGKLVDVYGGVFARPTSFGGEKGPRLRRPLRLPVPEIHEPRTADGLRLRLTRYKGGDKGPILVAPGFGTSARAFLLDTVETTFPEFLCEAGYDVWLFDYRASPDLPSAETSFTLDAVADFDWPTGVEAVRAATGAESIQALGHCVGSLTLLMALARGMKGVRSVISSQLTLHPMSVPLNQLRAHAHLANFLSALQVRTLTTDLHDNPSWAERIGDELLRLYPAGRERCSNPVCHRILFMYGEVFDHDQINEATHEALHEVFGVANLQTLEQISVMLREGHAVSASGEERYLGHPEHLRLPIAFIHGENNRLFIPEGSQRTLDYLVEHNGRELYSRHVIAGYAHMDCFIGTHADRDVYPVIVSELERHP